MDKKKYRITGQDQRFPGEERLKKNNEFENVIKNGKGWNGTYLRFLFVAAGERKVGFAVSKKHGNAVYRNRIKRLMREAYRKRKHEIGHYHIVMISRNTNECFSCRDFEKDIDRFISNIKGVG